MLTLPPPPPAPVPPPGWTPPRRRRLTRKRIAIGVAIWMVASLIAYAIDPPEDEPSGHRPAVEAGPVTA